MRMMRMRNCELLPHAMGTIASTEEANRMRNCKRFVRAMECFPNVDAMVPIACYENA